MNSERRKSFLICRRCNNSTIHTLQCSSESDIEFHDAEGYRMHEIAKYNVFQCEGCTRVSMYIWSPFHSSYSEFGEQVYPPLLQEIEGVPRAVMLAYQQAEQIRLHSTAAYAVLARKVLEAIAKDWGINENNLSTALSTLAAKGKIPPTLAEAATLIRTFGNAAAHECGTTINWIHLEMIEKFLAVLIEYLYTAPAALREFKFFLDIENEESAAD